MKKVFRFVLCLVSFLLFLTAAACARLYFFLRRKGHWTAVAVLNRLLAVFLVRIIGVRISVSGPRPARPARGLFLVSNHLGYLDGFVLGSLFPLIYTSKSELKRWPLFGAMSKLSGTLFIERDRKNHIAEYIRSMTQVLRQGGNLLFFPEGTSGNGEELLAFRSAFFEAPVQASSPIVPISLCYRKIDGIPVGRANRDQIYWYGDMTFMGHFFRLLSHRSVDVDVIFHEAIVPRAGQEKDFLRKDVSESACKAVASKLSRQAVLNQAGA